MLKEYEQKGKEFGLNHKVEYWKILLIFSITLLIVIPIFSAPMMLFIFIAAAQPDLTVIYDVVLYILQLWVKIFPFVITVPLAGYGMGLIADPNDNFNLRLARCFDCLKLKSVLVSIETTFYITLPIILAVGFNNHIKDSAFGFLYSKFGMMIPVLCDSLVLIIISFAVYQSFILSFKYFLVPFILALDPETSGKEARKRSSFMMLGHLNEFIELYSKLGLLFLVSLLFIIPLFWFIPYAYATITYYALDRLEYGGYVSFAEVELESYL